MSHKCTGKEEILDLLSYMIVYAPDFPKMDRMTLAIAYEDLEHGLTLIEKDDGRPPVRDAVLHMRKTLQRSRELFDQHETNPACHALQEVEEILKPLRVKASVA